MHAFDQPGQDHWLLLCPADKSEIVNVSLFNERLTGYVIQRGPDQDGIPQIAFRIPARYSKERVLKIVGAL